ncbi:MAG: alpha-amylase, partial [Bacteroidales bacterium]|nr:alpha-amylase [Bacteroidales bacterium]
MKANEPQKIIIYQIFTRLFGNRNFPRTTNGTLEENGCGKMDDISKKALREIQRLGITHVWYTGVIAHASQTDYSAYGIPSNHPSVVKGKAGSPYAIRDYYDIDPDLAVKVENRMKEFEALV